MRKGLTVTLAVLGIFLGLVIVSSMIDEDVSRDEDTWRKETSPHFQEDFAPGRGK